MITFVWHLPAASPVSFHYMYRKKMFWFVKQVEVMAILLSNITQPLKTLKAPSKVCDCVNLYFCLCICLVTISVTWLRCHLMAANVFTLVLQLYLVFLRTELSNHKSSKHVKKYIIVFCSKLQSSHMDED